MKSVTEKNSLIPFDFFFNELWNIENLFMNYVFFNIHFFQVAFY